MAVDPAALAGRSAEEIADVIIDAVRPADGSQDAEASRDAIAAAQSDLLAQFPDASLTALSPDQIDFVVQQYIGHDLCRRIELDVGKAVIAKAPDAATAIRRLDEIQEYACQLVAAHFRQHRNPGTPLTRHEAETLARTVLWEVLHVFEEYVE